MGAVWALDGSSYRTLFVSTIFFPWVPAKIVQSRPEVFPSEVASFTYETI